MFDNLPCRFNGHRSSAYRFCFSMTIFAGVGLASMFVKEDTTDDYLVAGRGMHPALAALSLSVLGTQDTCSSVLLDLLT